jgi:peptidoglycan/LPS O-acetylase OafA/YrhL
VTLQSAVAWGHTESRGRIWGRAGGCEGESLSTAQELQASDAPPAPRRSLGYRPELDGLRGVAVIIVVVYHVGDLLWPSGRTWLFPAGALGVDLFFVLSGFLITSLLLAERERRGAVDLRAFGRRRLLRLVPAMVGLLAVVLVVAMTTRRYVAVEALSTAGWSLTFTANWAIRDGRPYVLGHLWSVAVEGQFYVLWAVAVAVAVRFRHTAGVLAVTAVALVAAVAWWRYDRIEAGESYYLLYLATTSRLDAPLIGALAALAVHAGWLDRLRGRAATVVGLAGLAAVLACATRLRMSDPVLYRGLFSLVAVAAACAVVGAVRSGGGALARGLGVRPLVLAGMLSYSLYLWHVPIFQWLGDATPGWPAPVRSLVGTALAVAAALASYVLVERPFLRRRHTAAIGKQRSSSAPNA